MMNPRMARVGTISVRNKPSYFKDLRGLKLAEQDQDDEHDQNHPAKAHSGMAKTIAIAAKTAGEAAEQENNQDDDEDGAKRHRGLPMGGKGRGQRRQNAPRPGAKHTPGRESSLRRKGEIAAFPLPLW